MATESNSNQSMREVNILLLGETGVGKSTWINAFANYLTYDTLEDATQGNMVVLIPSEFTLMNDTFEKIKVAVGDRDANEVHARGQTGTRQPTSYAFKTSKDLLVRIIDTPGIGDTRGMQQDKQNFRTLMNHLSHVDYIHGICILLQPNNSHMSIFFQYCLTQILRRFHQDSTKNIAFCFTHARSTLYRPGDTLAPLEALLTKGFTTPILIPLEKRTMYCVDNKAIRFLAAVKHGVKFDDKQRQNFSNSWKTSAKEMGRMVEYYQSIQPHATRNTVTVNAIRQVIETLAKSLTEASENIQINIALLDDKSEELQNLKSKRKKLKSKLNISHLELGNVKLTHPKSVCAIDQNVQRLDFRTTDDQIQVAVAAMSQLEKRNKEYEIEQMIITRTAAKFAVFIEKNSITPFNSAIILDLCHMIELEEEKVSHGGVNTTAQQLKKLRGAYLEEEKILLEAMKASYGGIISLEDIQHSLDALYSLSLMGQSIQNLLITGAEAEKCCYTEKACTPKQVQQRGHELYTKIPKCRII